LLTAKYLVEEVGFEPT